MGGSNSPSFTQTTSLTGSQQRVAGTLGNYYNSVLPSQLGQPIKAYEKGNVLPTQAGYTSAVNNLSGMDATGGALGAASNAALTPALSAGTNYQNLSAAQGTVGQSANAGMMLANPNITDQYFQQGVVNPAMQNYNLNIAPNIDSGFSGYGGIFNSRRGYDQSQALSQMNVANDAQLAQANLSNLQQGANLMNQSQLATQQQQTQNSQFNAQSQNQMGQFNVSAQQAAMNQQMQASQLAQQNVTNNFNRAGSQVTAQQGLQSQQNVANQAMYQEYLRTQPYNNPYVAAASSYMNQPLATSVGYQSPSLGAQAGQAIGTLGQIPSALAGIGAGAGAISGLLGLGGTTAAATTGSTSAAAAAALAGLGSTGFGGIGGIGALLAIP